MQALNSKQALPFVYVGSLCLLVGVLAGFSFGVSKGSEWVGEGFDRGFAQATAIHTGQKRVPGAWKTIDLASVKPLCESIAKGFQIPSSKYEEIEAAGFDFDDLCKSAAKLPATANN